MARTPIADEKDAFSSEADKILDAFLLDMSAIDHNKQSSTKTRSEVVSTKSTKRKMTHSSDANMRTSNKKKRLNPSWIKRRRELEDLRLQAQSLETQRELLLSKMSRVSMTEAPKQHERNNEEEEKKKNFEAALEENKILKKKIRNLLVVQSTIVTKQLQSLALDAMRAAAARTLRISSPVVFDMLEARVNARFRRFEASLSTKQCIAIPNTTFVQNYNRNGDNCGTGTVEFKSTELLPFAENAISSTVWSFVEFGGFPDDHELRVTKRSENTCAVDSQMILRLESGGLAIRNGHSVVKRFETASGIVLMSEFVDDWVTDCDKASSGVQTIKGRACFVISSYIRGKNAVDSDVSKIQAEVTLSLDAASGIGHRQQTSETRKLNATVIPKVREILESRRQFVENALFDSIRAR